ncbi:MAG: hypothetical protein HC854_01885 [Flavobacterium sp.]|nr:hypothetical protein [Flavobacterium sp.]
MQQVVAKQKNDIFLLLDEYDTITNKKALKAKENLIKEEIENFNETVNEYAAFDKEYNAIAENAIKQLLFNTRQTNLFSKRYFMQKYKLEITTETRDTKEQLAQVEAAILENKVTLTKKDAFALSHLNLVLFLRDNDSVEEVKAKCQTIIEEQKPEIYTKWQNKEKENTIVDSLEVKLADGFIQNYLTKFQIK